FWVNLPLGFLAAAILIWALHERVEKRRYRIDWGGSILLCVGTTALMLALAEISSLSSAVIVTLFGLSVVSLFLFVLYEQRVAEPIWPMSLWQDRIVT